MEPEASKAAIAAIAALQKRVRELEDELKSLEAEKKAINARISARDQSYSIREKAFNQATAKAQEMLNSAAEAMDQVREAREESKRLKDQISITRTLLQTQDAKHNNFRNSERKWRASLARSNKLVNEYEALLPDIMNEPRYSVSLSPEEVVLLCSGADGSATLPDELDKILQELRNVPKKFFSGSVEAKIRSTRAIRRAHQAIRELYGRILDAEEGKCGDEKKAKRLSGHLVVLGNEIDRIDFQ
jgi:DNA repair exonuclease SbcCD ATPase subunit